MGRAVLLGTEGLGRGPTWYEKAAAWASEAMPIAADLRTLAFEAYKGATGCDKVQPWAIGLSAASLVLDCITLGGAKIVTTPLKAGMVAGKQFIKSIPLAIALPAAIEGASNAYLGYLNRMTQEASKEKADQPAWAHGADAFINFSRTKTEAAIANPQQIDDFTENFFGAMGGVNDVMALAEMYKEWGGQDFMEFMSTNE